MIVAKTLFMVCRGNGKTKGEFAITVESREVKYGDINDQ